MPPVFLDYQAATPLHPEVRLSMEPYMEKCFSNPASLHQHGLKARAAVADARERISRLLELGSPEEVIFTSGGTEALNLAIKGAAWAGERHGRHIVHSATEHPAVLESIEFLKSRGFEATAVSVNGLGMVDPAEFAAALKETTILICLHHANHETGAIQPVAAVGRLAEERGIPFLVDATASAGWIPVLPSEMKASLVAISPHRFYGPKGVGILCRTRRARLTPLLHGGNQEHGLRAGTENVAGIVGAARALEIAKEMVPAETNRLRKLQVRLYDLLHSAIPHAHRTGPEPGPARLPNFLSLALEFVEGEGVVLLSDLQGLAIASGSACLGQTLQMSHVLRAMGLEPELAQGNIILSLGRETSEVEVQQAVDILARVVDKLRRMSPSWDEFQQTRRQSLSGESQSEI